MTPSRFVFCFLLAVILTLPQTGFAESGGTPKLLGTFGNWKAFSYGGEKPVCYMTLATQVQSKTFKRGETYLMITHRPAENIKDVVSYTAGYSFKSPSDVTVDAGKKSFDLFTQKDTAWSRDPTTDHALASAIRGNAKIKLTGTPAGKNAKPVSDTIDLKGASAAYQAINKACGYPVEETKKKPEAKKTDAKAKKVNKTH